MRTPGLQAHPRGSGDSRSDVARLTLRTLSNHTRLGLAPLQGQGNRESAQAEPTPATRRAKVPENAALQPFGLKACPLPCDAGQIRATNRIDLVHENLLQFTNGIRRGRENPHAPRPCQRRVRVRVEKEVRQCLPDRSSMQQVFVGGFHGACRSRPAAALSRAGYRVSSGAWLVPVSLRSASHKFTSALCSLFP